MIKSEAMSSDKRCAVSWEFFFCGFVGERSPLWSPLFRKKCETGRSMDTAKKKSMCLVLKGISIRNI